MKNNKKMSLLFVVIIMMVVSFTFTGFSQELAKELIIAVTDEIEGTDAQTIGKMNLAHDCMYDNLITESKDGKSYLPQACESYTVSDDGLTWTFVFPEGAKFSNGDPFDAEAVKASFERMREVGEYAGLIENVKEFKVVDKQTLAMILEVFDPVFELTLCQGQMGVVDAKVAKEIGDDAFKTETIAYGVLALDEWVHGSHVTFKPNPYYTNRCPDVENKGPINFEKVTVRFIPDSFTIISELEQGTIDITRPVPLESVESLRANPDIKLYETETTGGVLIYMNTKDPVLSDIRIRQAITLGIDREEIASALNGFVSPSFTFMAPSTNSFSPEKEQEMAMKWATNHEKAAALLEEAGWVSKGKDGIREKDGEKLSIEMQTASDVNTIKLAAPIIQKQLKEIGIDLKIRELEHAYVKANAREGKYQLVTRSVEWIDPIHAVAFSTNSNYYSNEKLDKLINDAHFTAGREARIKAFELVTDEMFEQMPAVSLFYGITFTASRANIEGLWITKSFATKLVDVKKYK